MFAEYDARISRYAYLVSLLPATIVHELGLRVRLARRQVSSYTPDPRVAGRHGLLIDEILYRLSPESGRDHMPRDRVLTSAEREALEQYFRRLSASQSTKQSGAVERN